MLWKADVYRDEPEQRRQTSEVLSIPDVARVFDRDLEARGLDPRFDLERLDDFGFAAAVQAVYPEAVPIDKAPSIFDPA